MAQHGYLREWDEGWGGSDESGRDRDRERGWESDRDNRDSGRDAFMLDRGRDDDRGLFDRMGDRARDAFRGDDHHPGERWSSRDWRGSGRDEWRSGREGGADRERAPRSFSSHPDDHYRSWRDRQIQALDRDYEEYCRDREQQFHHDFDNWRSNRNRQQGSGSSMSDAQAVTADQERAQERAMAGQGNTPSPIGEATLGTNNSENSGIGRGKR